MSAWIFPVIDKQVVADMASPDSTASAPTEKTASTSDTGAKDRPLKKTTTAARNEVVPAAPSAATSHNTSRVKLEADEDTAASNFTIINPDALTPALSSRDGRREFASNPASQADNLTRSAQGDQSFDQEAIRKCQRRYNSFRSSDGTFQPYNSPTRELCPYLR